MKFLILVGFFGVVGAVRADDSDANREALVKMLKDPAVVNQAQTSEGFRLSKVQPGSVYESLGLQKDDVIVSADGKLVKSLKDAQALYSHPNAKELIVRRNGQTIRVR